MLSLGVYPDVSLKDARDRRDEARKLIANGIDPSKARQEEKAEAAAEALTFEHVAREWYERFKPKWGTVFSCPLISALEPDTAPDNSRSRSIAGTREVVRSAPHRHRSQKCQGHGQDVAAQG